MPRSEISVSIENVDLEGHPDRLDDDTKERRQSMISMRTVKGDAAVVKGRADRARLSIKSIPDKAPSSGKEKRKEARKERNKFLDQAPKNRTAMGEYIVPEAGQPLTANAQVTVGPANYTLPSLSLTEYHGPEWSILNRRIYSYTDKNRPAPNTYSLPDGITLKNKFTMRKRLKSNKKVISGPCRVGPTYSVKGHETGKNALGYSMPRAQRNKVMTGPPNGLVQPQDTLGFSTPGAELIEEGAVLPHSFHANFTSLPRTKREKTPGPTDYTPATQDSGLRKSFGLAHIPEYATNVPGPNEYDIGTMMGEGPAYSITLPVYTEYQRRGPSPCSYMKEREYDHKEKLTMGYRLPTPKPVKAPAPNAYNTVQQEGSATPAFSIKSRHKVSFPACQHSAFAEDQQYRSPGPAAHTISRYPDISDTGASIKKPHVTLSDGRRPGPSDYGRLECDPLSTKTNAPAFSMRPLWKPLDRGPNPGPAAYRTVPVEPGLAASMKGRSKSLTKQRLPAPNVYMPKKNCIRTGPVNDTGISMKSRHSPWVYSGFKRTV